MPRWYILRALLKKEALRYRYNWGLLVLVFALLALALLLSISSKMSILPGQDDPIRSCVVLYQETPFSTQWANALRDGPGPTNKQAQIMPASRRLSERRDVVFIELPAEKSEALSVRYGYYESGAVGLLLCRDWFTTNSQAFLGTTPRLIERTEQLTTRDTTPLVFTGLMLFALYIISFNLFITSTGEEREKKILLALLLSPTSPTELMLAKAIFYGGAGVFVAALITAMYRPDLLLYPIFWVTLVFSALGYIAVGIIALSIIRRQTTLGTVSILYMLITSIITFLGAVQPLFFVIKFFFLEDSLLRNFSALFGRTWLPYSSIVWQGILTTLWLSLALLLFRRRGVTMSR